MAGTFDTEIFRKKPMIGIVLGAVLVAIAIPGFYVEYQDYKSLGDAPVSMTIEEAVPATNVPDRARWVRISGALIPDCNSVLVERSNGSVNRTLFLASDESKQRWFHVSIRSDAPCAMPGDPVQGILKKAAPGLPAWLKDKGVTVPTSTYPLMDFAVNDGPGDIKMLLGAFLFMGVLGLGSMMFFLRLQSRM
jgi:hypothetical protein